MIHVASLQTLLEKINTSNKRHNFYLDASPHDQIRRFGLSFFPCSLKENRLFHCLETSIQGGFKGSFFILFSVVLYDILFICTKYFRSKFTFLKNCVLSTESWQITVKKNKIENFSSVTNVCFSWGTFS